jgi:AcrR family transcriptional regulator
MQRRPRSVPKRDEERLAKTKRPKPRRRDPVAAREALLAAAERIFNRESYFATNTNAIAAEAGYAAGTFYTHFDDKLSLFLAVYERWVQRVWKELRSATLEGDRKATLTEIIDVLAALHGRYVVFRRNLRVLDILERSVRVARNVQRHDQLEWMGQIVRSLGGGHASTEKRVLALFATERVMDALADGDLDAAQANEKRTKQELTRLLECLFFADAKTPTSTRRPLPRIRR